MKSRSFLVLIALIVAFASTVHAHVGHIEHCPPVSTKLKIKKKTCWRTATKTLHTATTPVYCPPPKTETETVTEISTSYVTVYPSHAPSSVSSAAPIYPPSSTAPSYAPSSVSSAAPIYPPSSSAPSYAPSSVSSAAPIYPPSSSASSYAPSSVSSAAPIHPPSPVPSPAGCSGTAYGYVPDHSTPKNQAWGWIIALTVAQLKDGYIGELYMGAGQSDISKATDVGGVGLSITLDQNQPTLLVNFSQDPQFNFGTKHVYISSTDPGTEHIGPGEFDRQGTQTSWEVSPSEVDEDGNTMSYLYDDNTVIYFILHAEVTGCKA